MSDKYMKEIEEILKQADGMLPKDRPRPAVGRPRVLGSPHQPPEPNHRRPGSEDIGG